jgi:hypothetical protein
MVAWSLAGRESVLGILARWMRRRRSAILPALRLFLRFVLILGALGMFTAAAWILALPAGLAAGGVSLLLLEWTVKRQ